MSLIAACRPPDECPVNNTGPGQKAFLLGWTGILTNPVGHVPRQEPIRSSIEAILREQFLQPDWARLQPVELRPTQLRLKDVAVRR